MNISTEEKYGLISAIIAYSGIFIQEFGIFRVFMLVIGAFGLICFWINEIDKTISDPSFFR